MVNLCLSRSSGPPPSADLLACYLDDEDGDGDVVVMEMMMLTKKIGLIGCILKALTILHVNVGL